MNDKIKALFIEPGKPARETEMDNTLEAFQCAVGGYIEVVPLGKEGIYMVVNEEGCIFGLQYNRQIGSYTLFGNIIVINTEGEEFASLTPEQLHFWDKFIENKWKMEHGFTARVVEVAE